MELCWLYGEVLKWEHSVTSLKKGLYSGEKLEAKGAAVLEVLEGKVSSQSITVHVSNIKRPRTASE